MVEWGFDSEGVGTHEAGAFDSGEESDRESALARNQEDLTAAAAPRGAEAASYAVRAQLGHGLAVSNAAKDRAEADYITFNHCVCLRSMPWAHLVKQVVAAVAAPPHLVVRGEVFDDFGQSL